MRRMALAFFLVLALPLALAGAPRGTEQKPDPRSGPAVPSYVQRVEPAVVGIKVQVPGERPSALTLGRERWGSGVIFDPQGYALTVSYVLLDAGSIEVRLRDGRSVPGRGEKIRSQEEFYRLPWQTRVGQEITLLVVRESRFEAITVRPADRYRFFRTTGG